jgi:hypothetical protein
MKNLDKYVNDNYKLSLDEGFGTWIHNGVWYGDESLTFEEAKEVFFLTLKKLLDDEQVILSPFFGKISRMYWMISSLGMSQTSHLY